MAGLFALAAAGTAPVASAAAQSPRLGSRVLHRGARGPDVRALQRDLAAAGFRTATTADFGAQTTHSVQSFQRRYQLKDNGVADRSFVRDLLKVRALDAAELDATSGSGGSGLGGGKAKVKVRTKTTSTRTKTKGRNRRQSRKARTTSDPTSVLGSPIMAPVAQDGGSEHLGERTLRQGMNGHDVKVLQSYLTLAGYPTGVDGGFGPSTESAVVTFEQANGLPTNGVVTYSQSRTLREDVAKATTATGAPGQATLNPDGTVTAPAGAPQIVQQVIAAANSIIAKPYIYGGGHGQFNDSGYDCSGAVSFALHGGNLLNSPEDSTGLESYGSSGAGQWITVYADAGHAFMVVAGLAFDTAHYGPTTPGGSGPRWLTPTNGSANLTDGGNYIVRHPSGL